MINQTIDNPCQGRLIAVAKPRGSIHLGELTGAIETWVNLQNHFECIFVVSDRGLQGSSDILQKAEKQSVLEMLADWLAVGINPNYSIIVLESALTELPQFTELFQNLIQNKIISEWNGGSIHSPEILDVMELLLFKADTVPFVEGQGLESLQDAQQLGTSFNKQFGKVFPYIKPHFIRGGRLLGLDSRPMQREFENIILLKEFDEETEQKINRAPLDTLIMYDSRFDVEKNRANKVITDFQSGHMSEQNLRKHVSVLLSTYLHSMRVKRDKWIANPEELDLILQVGARRAQALASETFRDVKAHIYQQRY
jgi:tryptophanyl-tRNA synthetase